MIEAKPASEPTELMKWWTEKAKGIDPMSPLAVYVAIRAPGLSGTARAAASRETCSASTGASPSRTSRLIFEKVVLDPGRIERLAVGAEDLLRRSRLRALVGVEQFLVELLAGPGADDLDRDVALGLEARRAGSSSRRGR